MIALSSALSWTYQSAVLAKNMLEYEACYIVDSLTATAGERILVERALQLRSAGHCEKEIALELASLRSRITLYACIDTLKYLHSRRDSTAAVTNINRNCQTILELQAMISVGLYRARWLRRRN